MKLIRLETWAASIYGDDAPSARTLTRWAKAGKIQPAEQHGRRWFVSPDARYTDRPAIGRTRLVERINAESHVA